MPTVDAIELPYPADWQSRREYLVDRIIRLDRARFYCRGRAADIRHDVEVEINRLRTILATIEKREDADERQTRQP